MTLIFHLLLFNQTFLLHKETLKCLNNSYNVPSNTDDITKINTDQSFTFIIKAEIQNDLQHQNTPKLKNKNSSFYP